MPAQNTKKPVQPTAKPVANAKPSKALPAVTPKAMIQKPDTKEKLVIESKSTVKAPSVELKKAVPTAVVAEIVIKKKPGRPPKAAAVESGAESISGAKRGRKAKNATELDSTDDLDMADIEADLVGEPVVTGEKVKPLRMKISKAKERALMKEFGLDETVLSEEDMAKRRQRLKALIKLGKTRGYLTHGEISDHLPDKLVDAETLEVVISMLNDMGVAVYEQTPDAETLLLNNNVSTAATEEEAEEEAEAALSTVDSEFGRTTDPVRMYMREMGTVELLTREGEIEIAKRIEGGLMAMMEAISASPATIAEILRLSEDIREGKVVITTIVDGFSE
jgi:RNA polymerase primary sigma factor